MPASMQTNAIVPIRTGYVSGVSAGRVKNKNKP